MRGDNLPKITFGIIVLNGEPYTRYCIRALYPYAHQIIVVEGACRGAEAMSTPDGHSQDGTIEILKQIKVEEDPEDKLVIVTAEDEGHTNGFWPGEKHEQSQAYARRATGDYLWQIDIDEFYKPDDMQRVIDMLREDPDITAVSFRQIQFWGGFDYYVDGWYLRRGGSQFHRLFKWGKEYKYYNHRPPTVLDAEGNDTRALKWVSAARLALDEIFLYHYSFVFPKQVLEKTTYYAAASWANRPDAEDWAQNVYVSLRQPYHAHIVSKYPGWLERYHGTHPPQIEALRTDLLNGSLCIETRHTHDIEALLKSPLYRLGTLALKIAEPMDKYYCLWKPQLKRFGNDPIGVLKRRLTRLYL